jgi:hypothetical protein
MVERNGDVSEKAVKRETRTMEKTPNEIRKASVCRWFGVDLFFNCN